MAFEPLGNSPSKDSAGESGEAREPSSQSPAISGFAEATALFRAVDDLPVELRALRGILDTAFLRWAAARADTLNIPGDAVVRHSGVLSADTLLKIYADDLGVDVDLLEHGPDGQADVTESLSSGVLRRQRNDGQNCVTISLAGENVRALYQRTAENESLEKEIRITSHERLRAFLERSQGRSLAHTAAFGLLERRPEFSAGSPGQARNRVAFLTGLLTAALSIHFFPHPSLLAIEFALAAIFLAWATLRLYACVSVNRFEQSKSLSEAELPIYSILVPLHREAGIVADLVDAISALNYPREKLDVKLILEADDTATIAAVKAVRLDPCFEIVFAPAAGPRTKPKALRAALPFVRGEFVVIYDAEDRPHPNQLRDACRIFAEGNERLACVQAKLAVDNTRSTFFTSHFRAEYSGLFDVLLPALARLHLPLPLGGTSNHFKTEALRQAGGWDPHNVTEDADLGVRLARYGYSTDVVDSTTWEEAPAKFSAWLPQRTRWMKGWLHTSSAIFI